MQLFCELGKLLLVRFLWKLFGIGVRVRVYMLKLWRVSSVGAFLNSVRAFQAD